MGPSDSPGQDTAAKQFVEPGFAQNTIERLFEFSPDAILVTDADGVMRAANPRAEELFGYATEELIGQPVEILVPARFRSGHPRHRENYSAHPRTRQMGAALNLFGLRKDGTEFPVDIMLKPMQTDSGPAVVSFIRDATEQRAAQEALRLNDLRLRSIVESIGEYAIYLLDRDGHVLTWNPGAERIKGYKADEVLGLHFSRFFTQEDHGARPPRRVAAPGRPRERVEEEDWRVRKDGSRFWANVVITAIRDSSGEVTGFAKVTRDVTDRKQAQRVGDRRAEQRAAGQCGHSQSCSERFQPACARWFRTMTPTLALFMSPAARLRVQFLAGTGTDAVSGRIAASDPTALPPGRPSARAQPVILDKH